MNPTNAADEFRATTQSTGIHQHHPQETTHFGANVSEMVQSVVVGAHEPYHQGGPTIARSAIVEMIPLHFR
jgi:hypothetical protein